MPSENTSRGRIWNNLPLSIKGLTLLMVPAPALLVTAMVLSGAIREQRQALAKVDQLTAGRERLQEITALLLKPGAPLEDYRAMGALSRNLDAVSFDPSRQREIEVAIQDKLESLAALSAITSPDESLLDKNRQATASLQSLLNATAIESDHLLSSELSHVKTVRSRLFSAGFQGAFIFLLGEFLAAVVFLAAITGQIQTLKINSRRLAKGLPLQPLFTDNWELNQIGHDLIQASVALHERERELQATRSETPESDPRQSHVAVESLESTVAQLRDRNRDLAGSLSAARESVAAKGRFLTDLSRELRIPLSSILGFSELLYDGKLGPVSEQQKGCLSDILAGSKRMLQLTDSVAGAISAENIPAPADVPAVDLEKIAREVQYLLVPAARKKGVRVEIDIDPGVREIEGDPEKLKQVLHQHMANAIQFTPHDALLEISLRPEGENAVRLEVHSKGLGLTSKDVVRLFPEFHVASSSVKIQSDQQDVAAAEDDAVFYAILRGVSRPVESTVRPRSSKAHAASRNTSALIQ
jgi:signal transduction histidine kinase